MDRACDRQRPHGCTAAAATAAASVVSVNVTVTTSVLPDASDVGKAAPTARALRGLGGRPILPRRPPQHLLPPHRQTEGLEALLRPLPRPPRMPRRRPLRPGALRNLGRHERKRARTHLAPPRPRPVRLGERPRAVAVMSLRPGEPHRRRKPHRGTRRGQPCGRHRTAMPRLGSSRTGSSW